MGSDLPKSSLPVYVADEADCRVLRMKLTRASLPGFIAWLRICIPVPSVSFFSGIQPYAATRA